MAGSQQLGFLFAYPKRDHNFDNQPYDTTLVNQVVRVPLQTFGVSGNVRFRTWLGHPACSVDPGSQWPGL